MRLVQERYYNALSYVRVEGRGKQGLHSQSPAIHHRAGGLVMRVPLWRNESGGS